MNSIGFKSNLLKSCSKLNRITQKLRIEHKYSKPPEFRQFPNGCAHYGRCICFCVLQTAVWDVSKRVQKSVQFHHHLDSVFSLMALVHQWLWLWDAGTEVNRSFVGKVRDRCKMPVLDSHNVCMAFRWIDAKILALHRSFDKHHFRQMKGLAQVKHPTPMQFERNRDVSLSHIDMCLGKYRMFHEHHQQSNQLHLMCIHHDLFRQMDRSTASEGILWIFPMQNIFHNLKPKNNQVYQQLYWSSSYL